MLKNYLVVAVRTLRRSAFLSAATIVGLAVGLAACILILLYIHDELSFDSMHAHADRIVRVVEEREGADGGRQHFVFSSGALGPELVRSSPMVEKSARMVGAWATGRRVVQRGDARFYVGDHAFTEPTFFEMFDFPFVAGTASGALDEPNEVVLTVESAERYFGQEDMLGRTVEVEGMGDFTVTGVVDLPENTHIFQTIFFSFESLMQEEGWRNWLSSWESTGVTTYLQLASGASATSVEPVAAALMVQHAVEEAGQMRMPHLQPLSDIHLKSGHIEFDANRAKGSPAYLYLFGAVALFVVLIAAINYTNMSTARSMGRAKEVGLRKAIGALRGQLMRQFLVESLLSACAALILAAALVWLALPLFNSISGKAIEFTGSAAWVLVGGGIILALAVGLGAGSYPAFYLSRQRPEEVLQGTGRGVGTANAPLRKSLVVVQFAMSIALIIATLALHQQLEFIQSTRLGFDKEQLVVVDINDGRVRNAFETVKDEFARVPGVEAVTVSNRIPGDWKNIPQVDFAHAGDEQITIVHFLGVDEDFLDTYEIELIEGENFGRGLATDSTSVLVNETAARQLGLSIGDVVRVPEDDSCADCPNVFEARVAGVVGDFHYESLHRPIGPLVMGYRANPLDYIDYFTVRMDTRSVPATIAALRVIGERFDPDHPFEFNSLDVRLADFYTSERQVRSVIGAAALLAILIACLGLFGLAAFMAERRTKEIGIRKVLGATVGQIVRLLTGEFAWLVGIAFVVASPLAYLAIRWWLQDFAYRAPVSLSVFLLAGGASLLLAVLTVSYQSIRAALADPVKSLRYE